MKRITGLLVLMMALGASVLSAKEFQEGTHYLPIQPAPAQGQGKDVEVLEFFMYGCPHCNQLEPHMVDWLARKPENVKFIRVPALFRGPAQLHARAFYALELMGEGERIHPLFFHAIHKEKKRLNSLPELETFLVSKGVDGTKFRDAMNAPQVQAQLTKALQLMKKYEIKGVPALFVDGRYQNGPGLRSYREFTEVVDFLVDKVLKDRQGAATH